MDTEDALAFVEIHHHAVMTTLRSDGGPQLSPVAVGRDGSTVVVSTRETAFKTRNLERDARVWLCVFPDAFFGEWVQIEGPAEIVRLPEAMPLLESYYRSISGEHPDWDEYRAAMVSERRVVVRVRPTRVGPTVQG